MISVSKDWVEAHKSTLLPEMFVEISSLVTEPGLQENAGLTTNNTAYIGESLNILNPDYTDKMYVTLDHGSWGLDGTLPFTTDSYVDGGYVSGGVSGENCVFTTAQTITFEFSLYLGLVPGITITWSNVREEWATEFEVEIHNSAGLIEKKTITDNASKESVIWWDLTGFNKIVLRILKWNFPYRRARCSNVMFGVKRVYTKDDLLGFEHNQSVDLLSAKLPQSDITFRLRNDNNLWNPDDPLNFEKYLSEEQKVNIRYGMDVNGEIEWIKGGAFWLSEWETPSNGMEAVFKARDAISFMVNEYTGPRVGTLYDIAKAAIEQEDFYGEYLIDGSLENISVDFSDNTNNYTTSEILQMAAHAARCVFYQNRNGVIVIEPWKRVFSDYTIDGNVSFSHPEYTFGKPLKAISVTYGEEQRVLLDVSTKGETQTVDNPFISTQEAAYEIAETAKEILENRKVISGEYRADVRLDALDTVMVISKYASNIIGITDIQYSTTGGAIKATYTGRVVSVESINEVYYCGELYSGEI